MRGPVACCWAVSLTRRSGPNLGINDTWSTVKSPRRRWARKVVLGVLLVPTRVVSGPGKVGVRGCGDLQPGACGVAYKPNFCTLTTAVQNIFVHRSMAEPMSIIAGISSVTSLADVSCSLAGSLYKTFRAIKDAPRTVQRLSKELERLHELLQDVDNLLQRYSTSLLVTEDGLSIDSVQSVLQECQAELESVQKLTATFEKQTSKVKNTTARFRWVVDERKIKQHCQMIEQLRQHLNTGLSLLSQYVESWN